MSPDTKARNGVWTPWAQILCVECDYTALKDGPRAQKTKTPPAQSAQGRQ